VDDDRSVRTVLRSFISFRLPNVDCTIVGSAPHALQVVATEPVDVILTDYVMPGMDGLTLAQALRALGFTGPIVLLTGLADLQAAARAAGVTQVIEKPVRLSVLDDLITRLLVG
jgi:CheY-like chemotaxis protein